MTDDKNQDPKTDAQHELPVESGTNPPPAFGCIVYFSAEGGVYCGRVANLVGISETAASQRDLLAKIVKRFKAEVSKSLESGTEPPWIDPPLTKTDVEKKLFLPVHLEDWNSTAIQTSQRFRASCLTRMSTGFQVRILSVHRGIPLALA